MRTKHSLLLVLTVATAVLVTFNHLCRAEQQAPADANKSTLRLPQLEPAEVATNAMMERLAREDPLRAEELEKLRETDPEKFREEIMKAMREITHRRGKSRAEQEYRRGAHPRMEMSRGERGRRSSAIMRQRHEEFIEWLQDNYPDQAKELLELKDQDPQLYMRKLGLNFETYGRIAEIAGENPKLAEILKKDLELKKRRDSLLGRIKNATDEKEKQQLIKELEGVVGARFDLIIERTQMRYEHLRKKLERLREELKRNEDTVEKWKDPEFKKQNVKARLEKLLSESEKFDWE